jgi:hypothetical protein
MSAIPNGNDVVCGRSGAFRLHPGNQLFQKQIEDHMGGYDAASKFEKGIIISKMISSLRFVQKDPFTGTFTEVDDYLAVSNVVADSSSIPLSSYRKLISLLFYSEKRHRRHFVTRSGASTNQVATRK